MFTEKDIIQIKNHGLTEELVSNQIQNFKLGFDSVVLDRPAKVNDGIIRLSSNQVQAQAFLFDKLCKGKEVIKFVPASGAATRMFKMIYDLDHYLAENTIDDESVIIEAGHEKALRLIKALPVMACAESLEACLKKDGLSLTQLLAEKKYREIIQYYLTDKGLNYGHLPKGLIMFHSYNGEDRLAVAEQMIEAVKYASVEGICRLHFTVSPEHLEDFKATVEQLKVTFEEKYNVRYDVSFSCQKSSTDTIAVDLNNELFRDDKGDLIFRPAGHGALIENLNDLNADLVFIKNIDNVQREENAEEVIAYKKALGAILLSLQNRVFDYMEDIEDGNMDDEYLDQVADFCKNELCIEITPAFAGFEVMEKLDYLYTLLNRPMRVCGMVKNEGEPGGGPFWVEHEDGNLSLQIVEQSQVDKSDKEQKHIAESATHFNPVDLVCGLKDYCGDQFDLEDYIDYDTAFITEKSFEGRKLKAMEKPGLWNGAMSDWITLFVEVPASSFTPVKTVYDLLRDEHK